MENSKGVFISYRRESGAAEARIVEEFLDRNGFDVFLDVDSMTSGHFDEQLLRQIEARRHFILICSPGSLERCANEGDWVRREIAHAIHLRRNIVPVQTSRFEWPSPASLPAELRDLPLHNAFPYNHQFWKKTRQGLLDMLGTAPAPLIVTPAPSPATRSPDPETFAPDTGLKAAPTTDQTITPELNEALDHCMRHWPGPAFRGDGFATAIDAIQSRLRDTTPPNRWCLQMDLLVAKACVAELEPNPQHRWERSQRVASDLRRGMLDWPQPLDFPGERWKLLLKLLASLLRAGCQDEILQVTRHLLSEFKTRLAKEFGFFNTVDWVAIARRALPLVAIAIECRQRAAAMDWLSTDVYEPWMAGRRLALLQWDLIPRVGMGPHSEPLVSIRAQRNRSAHSTPDAGNSGTAGHAVNSKHGIHPGYTALKGCIDWTLRYSAGDSSMPLLRLVDCLSEEISPSLDSQRLDWLEPSARALFHVGELGHALQMCAKALDCLISPLTAALAYEVLLGAALVQPEESPAWRARYLRVAIGELSQCGSGERLMRLGLSQESLKSLGLGAFFRKFVLPDHLAGIRNVHESPRALTAHGSTLVPLVPREALHASLELQGSADGDALSDHCLRSRCREVFSDHIVDRIGPEPQMAEFSMSLSGIQALLEDSYHPPVHCQSLVITSGTLDWLWTGWSRRRSTDRSIGRRKALERFDELFPKLDSVIMQSSDIHWARNPEPPKTVQHRIDFELVLRRESVTSPNRHVVIRPGRLPVTVLGKVGRRGFSLQSDRVLQVQTGDLKFTMAIQVGDGCTEIQLDSLRGLTCLELVGDRTRLKAVRILNCPALTALSFAFCSELSSLSIQACARLEKLDVSCCPKLKREKIALDALPNLQTLDLQVCRALPTELQRLFTRVPNAGGQAASKDSAGAPGAAFGPWTC